MKKSLLICLMGLSLILGACKISGDHDDAPPASDQSISVAIADDTDNNGAADVNFNLVYDSNGFVQTASVYASANPSNGFRPSISYTTENGMKVCSVDIESNGTIDVKYCYSFNSNGSIASVLQDAGANGSFGDSGDRRIDYAYDASGRVLTRTYYKTLNASDGTGGVVDFALDYVYTGSNLRPDSITRAGNDRITFTYSTDGKTITAVEDNHIDGHPDSSWVYTLSGNTGVIFDQIQFLEFLGS